MGRKLTGSLTKDEEGELKEWLSTSEENQQGYQKIKSLWEEPVESEEDPGYLYDRLKLRMQHASLKEPRVVRLMQWKIAVSILILLSIGLSTALVLKEKRGYASMVLQTEKGQRSFAQLPDGSKVWLNADTKLTIGDFSEKQRNVSLSGEAQFEVAHDKNRPFQVSFNHLNVEVLGTTFNVRSYEDEEFVTVSLLEGSVQLSDNNSHKNVILKPGQVALYNKNKESLIVNNDKNIEDNTSWRDGVLVFHSIPFHLLIQEIERSYNVTVNYKKNDFSNIHYTGSIDNLKITQVMQFLSYTIPMNYNVDKNEININLKK